MKILLLSDTHTRHNDIDFADIKDENIDILIHSGDFSSSSKSFYKFIEWLEDIDIKNKIIVPGNHDYECFINSEKTKKYCDKKNIILLIDKEITINNYKIYGSPWTPIFYNWYFMKEDELLEAEWDKIPLDTDILITHGPAFGMLDKINDNFSVGSKTLADKIKTLKNLKLHTFGHIHESNGIEKRDGIIHVNASTLNGKAQIQEENQYYVIEI